MTLGLLGLALRLAAAFIGVALGPTRIIVGFGGFAIVRGSNPRARHFPCRNASALCATSGPSLCCSCS